MSMGFLLHLAVAIQTVESASGGRGEPYSPGPPFPSRSPQDGNRGRIAMIRVQTSKVELTSTDVAYTIRRIVLQRCAVRAAEIAAALALRKAKIGDILSKFPDRHPVPLLLRSEYGLRGESISEEPAVRGRREFWSKIAAEAGPTDYASVEEGDGTTVSTSRTQDRSGLTNDSSVPLYELRREGDVKQEANCEAIDTTDECDRSKTDGDDILSQPGTYDSKQEEQRGTFDGACVVLYDGASGGREFCSPSTSVSSFNWQLKAVEDEKRGDDSDDDPSSSEFEEDVLSESELSSPRMSQLGGSGLPQLDGTVNHAEEASFFALHQFFSAQLNFDGAPEPPSGHISPSQSFLSLPPLYFPDIQESPSPTPGATQFLPSSRTGGTTMGLPIWRNSDYDPPTPRRVRRYRPRTSTDSFEGSEPASSHGHTEAQDPNAQVAQARSRSATQMSDEAMPLDSGDEMTEDGHGSLRYPFLGELMFGVVEMRLNSFSGESSVTGGNGRYNSEFVGAGGPVQLPDTVAAFSYNGSENSSEPRPSPMLAVPPPSPAQQTVGHSTRHVQVYSDNQSTSTRYRHPRRTPGSVTPSANVRAIARLFRVGEVVELENMVETAVETERERRGRELVLPEHWIHNVQTAREEFDEWMSLNGGRRAT